MPKTIHDLFSDWGSSKRTLPERNTVLRSEVLAKLSSAGMPSHAPKRNLPWFSLAFAGLAVIMLIVNVVPSQRSTPASMEAVGGMPSTGVTGAYDSAEFAQPLSAMKSELNSMKRVAPDYYPMPPQPGTDITDKREFLKTDYHAEIRTRDVSELGQRIRNIIKGSDGRVDGMNISDKYGYLNFAVPADKFDAFQSQIRGLVGSRFIVETINTQNLLPQKQSIEQQQEEINQKLTAVKNQRASLITRHNRTIASLQAQLQSATGDQERAQITAQIANENASYNKQLASLNSQINDYTAMLKNTDKQNTQLLNNVATVNGSISLRWIGVWEILDLYLGSYWISIVLAVLAIGAYLRHRSKRMMMVA
ncbi:MAG: hypothetical protein A3A33_01130 [Candidatus Yanofskybacteria bacterium RIFCSPLOWO2_01_FULL_49_25]|uniref:DUF4349 domain-containing protein n=1 Tax=Candidatus Yanofskybacteria bacterium RIFCSPLOWO2_01_FULL_49_25 TaxID=1802701 RepID=A0A1F8GVE4_9BACT|nr:MAG: hypothetical protein A3A33_01130 [Candidatus Yanofskybacteria bacterium RIFCSPLOWO2_01_FULL_49_25]